MRTRSICTTVVAIGALTCAPLTAASAAPDAAPGGSLAGTTVVQEVGDTLVVTADQGWPTTSPSGVRAPLS